MCASLCHCTAPMGELPGRLLRSVQTHADISTSANPATHEQAHTHTHLQLYIDTRKCTHILLVSCHKCSAMVVSSVLQMLTAGHRC